MSYLNFQRNLSHSIINPFLLSFFATAIFGFFINLFTLFPFSHENWKIIPMPSIFIQIGTKTDDNNHFCEITYYYD